jgi:hypothetical protein
VVRRLRVKVMTEFKGRARQEVRLESIVPLDLQLIEKWKSSWFTNKDYKSWQKEDWPQSLGEHKEGKILKGVYETASGLKTLKGDILLFRSFISDGAGGKKGLPMILYGPVKKHLSPELFLPSLNLDKEQENELKSKLKSDDWAPLAIWHHEKVDPTQKSPLTDLLDYALKYSRALMNQDFKRSGWDSFVETDVLKK